MFKFPDVSPVIEEITRIGTYETDLLTGTWTGSENFIKIFGLPMKDRYTVEEFQAIVHPEDRDAVMSYFAQCLSERKDFNYEYRCLRTTGEVIYVMSRSKISYREDGVPLKIVGVKQDVTESRLKELRLSALAENNRKKNEVLSMVAHDLLSPFNQLEALALLLKHDDQADNHLISLQQGICQSARRLIDELIEIAELEDEVYTLRLTEHNIEGLLEKSAERFALVCEDKRITLKTNFCGDAVARVNPAKFSRAIDNLLSNAIKFTPENRSIELITEHVDDCLRIIVKDEGVGIKAEHLPFLFDKFSKRVRRPGTRGEPSHGLGLSIVKHIITLHKGTVTAYSKLNYGTSFVIELPR